MPLLRLSTSSMDGRARVPHFSSRSAAHVLARIREGERIFATENDAADPGPRRGKDENGLVVGLCAQLSAVRRRRTADGRLPVRRQPVGRLRGAPPRRHRGILQCDGYAGYRKIAGGPHANGLRLAGCWAHLRRRSSTSTPMASRSSRRRRSSR